MSRIYDYEMRIVELRGERCGRDERGSHRYLMCLAQGGHCPPEVYEAGSARPTKILPMFMQGRECSLKRRIMPIVSIACWFLWTQLVIEFKRNIVFGR